VRPSALTKNFSATPAARFAGSLAMLRELSIKNFAIIDDLQIRFDAGLTIMSGETGAGKSIIINAVQLLLGARATAKLIRTGADNAELGAFSIWPPQRRRQRSWRRRATAPRKAF